MGVRIVGWLCAIHLFSAAISYGQSPALADTAPWFREEATERGLEFLHVSGHDGRFLFPEIHAGGAALFDADQDGDLDVYLVQSGSLVAAPDQQSGNQLFFNRGNGEFRKADPKNGADDRGYGMGVATGDFDNDGILDIYETAGAITTHGRIYLDSDPYAEPNLLMRGLPGPRYQEVLPRGGTVELLVATSRAAAFGDVDGDGGMDVLVLNRDAPAYLLINQAPDRGNWLRVLARNDDGSPALGASVIVTIGEQTIRREAHSTFSYQAANDPAAHFGLGQAETIDCLVVRWPDGWRRCLGPQKANQTLEIERSDGTECPTERGSPDRAGNPSRR